MDNPKILYPELSRWIRNNYKINLETGEIYKPASKVVKIICELNGDSNNGENAHNPDGK